jgi:putative membrane protein
VQVATGIAIAFHLSGVIAIGFFRSPFFIALTPLNLLVCLALVWWTQPQRNLAFVIFAAAAYLLGYFTEWIGIHYGWLFGDYHYGTLLGPKWLDVPLMIGVQWLVTMYCAGVSMHLLHQFLVRRLTGGGTGVAPWITGVALVVDAALLAVCFDWVIEPVAMRLGYWHWANDEIPWLNYFSWFGVSLIIQVIFYLLPFRKHNLFAVHLLLIQVMFFLLLRTIWSAGF